MVRRWHFLSPLFPTFGLGVRGEVLSTGWSELWRRKSREREEERRGKRREVVPTSLFFSSLFPLSGRDEYSYADCGSPSSTWRQVTTRKNVSGKKLIFPCIVTCRQVDDVPPGRKALKGWSIKSMTSDKPKTNLPGLINATGESIDTLSLRGNSSLKMLKNVNHRRRNRRRVPRKRKTQRRP